MATKKTSGRTGKKRAAREKIFVVAFKTKRSADVLSITDNLDEAKSASIPKLEKSPDGPRKPVDDKNTFASLQRDVTRTIRKHLALDHLMSVLDGLKGDFQFVFKIDPTLKKYGAVVFEDETRKIFEMDNAHISELTRSLRDATEGVRGIQQLPRLCLIGLISEYDVFLHRLIRTGLAAHEGNLARIERSLSLKELRQFGTIDEAKEYLIEREIDTILYDDHFEQLSSISKLFNITIDMADDCVKTFLESCERRNLFTHNDGVVNSRYLGKCKQFGISTGGLKAGDVLDVKSRYYNDAISTTHELSIKLIQFLWRKLVPAERKQADEELNDAAYELLRAGDFALAERILDYALEHAGPREDYMRRMMIINHALAVKRTGDKERAVKELERVDWSASAMKFQIAVAAVNDDMDGIVRMMPSVAQSELGEQEFRVWPVFKEARADKRFQDTFRKLFGSELVSASTIAASRALQESENISSPERSQSEVKITKH